MCLKSWIGSGVLEKSCAGRACGQFHAVYCASGTRGGLNSSPCDVLGFRLERGASLSESPKGALPEWGLDLPVDITAKMMAWPQHDGFDKERRSERLAKGSLDGFLQDTILRCRVHRTFVEGLSCLQTISFGELRAAVIRQLPSSASWKPCNKRFQLSGLHFGPAKVQLVD